MAIEIVIEGRDEGGSNLLKSVASGFGDIESRAAIVNQTLNQSGLRVRETSAEFQNLQRFAVSALGIIRTETASTDTTLGKVVNTLARLAQAGLSGGKLGLVSEAALIGLKTLVSHLDQTDRTARRAAQSLGQLGPAAAGPLNETAAAASMTRREFSQLGMAATSGLYLIGTEASKTNQQLADLIGKATSVGQAFFFGNLASAAIMAVAVGIGAYVSEMNRAAEETQKAIEPLQKLREELAAIDNLSDNLAQSLRQNLGLDKQTATNVADLARASEAYKALVDQRVRADEGYIEQQRKVQAAYQKMIEVQTTFVYNENITITTVQEAVDAYEKESAVLGELYNARSAEIGRLVEQADAQATLNETMQRASEMDDYYQRMIRNQAAGYGVLRDRVDEYRSALEKANQAANAIFRGMVEKALSPTEVTSADMAATQAGTYTDKWDEARRRFEAMAKGQGQADWMAEADMLKALGLSAEEAARKFRDFSLFADPKNLSMGLINWDALTVDVEGQLDAMIGKFNVTQEAVSKVWDNMAPEKKAALKKLGIASLDDATKSLLGLKPSTLNIVAAPEFGTNLANMRQMILDSIPPEMYTTVYVTYKAAHPGGGGGGSGNEGASQGKGSMPLDLSGARSGGVTEYQHGGRGVFTRDQLIGVHAGEAFWISGTRHQVAPPGQGITNNFTISLGASGGSALDRKAARRFARYLKYMQ